MNQEFLAALSGAEAAAPSEAILGRRMDVIRETFEHLPSAPDLTVAEHLAMAEDLAGTLAKVFPTPEQIAAVEEALVDQQPLAPILAHLGAKLARSRIAVGSIDEPVFVSIVVAVYKEHVRIRTSDEHPHGEDFLNRKLHQLHRLFDGNPNVGFELILVDDGCPEGTGRIAAEILESRPDAGCARVLFLAGGIERGDPVASSLSSTDDSRKGGAILYGMWDATRRERAGRHVVIFTDADLSTHLGQAGLLIEPILAGSDSAVGSRRERLSIVLKKGVRNDRGKLFIYLWKRLLPTLGEIVDTQCGFKAFDAALVRRIVTEIDEKQFAFDIELVLRTLAERPDAISKVPVCWIDSDDESTVEAFEPYLGMLRSTVAMYRRYLPRSAQTDRFARFIESLDPAAWDRLVENIPAAITSREPTEFGRFEGVSVEELERAAATPSPD